MPMPKSSIFADVEGFDIIGDVHGCALTLERLLQKLDYKKEDGVYYHPYRRAVFVGDVIDRGPRIREALKIVRSMVDAGQAKCILGNHEFNAVAYTTLLNPAEVDNGSEPRYLRPHDRRSNRLINETLIQFASYPEEWRGYLEWFKTLPIFLEMDTFRVVHACWDNSSVNVLRSHSPSGGEPVLNDILPLLIAGEDVTVPRCLDRLTRGTSLRYPDNRYVLSKDGLKRYIFRTKFWSDKPEVYQDVVFQPDPLPEDLSERPLDEQEKACLIRYPKNQRPVFFGHYWLHGRPTIQRANLVCLDYSAVKYGRLVAYRYDGEAELDNDKFVWIYVNPDVKEAS